jgi:hypothetical protein
LISGSCGLQPVAIGVWGFEKVTEKLMLQGIRKLVGDKTGMDF